MGLAMVVAKVAFSAPLPPEMLFNYTGRLLGVPWIFNLVHRLPWGLDRYAKFGLFGVSVAFFLGLCFLLALAYPSLRRRVGVGAVLLYPTGMVLLVGLGLLPLQGLRPFGLGANNYFFPPLATHLWAALFGLVLGVLAALLQRRRSLTSDDGRRDAVRLVTRAIAAGLGLSWLSGLLTGLAARAQGLFATVAELSPEVTPTRDHYQVSKNVFNPSVPERNWSLRLSGLVSNPLELSLEDLKALPAVERTSTLTCISNEVGGDLIGNSLWTGVPLASLLEMAGVLPEASELILYAADNYSDSFPLEAALREGTVVAYLQNGEPLTRDHGFPARVLVPGIYGMKNVKWVQEIELSSEDHQGYWQTRGWSDSAIIQTMSRIDTSRATRLDDGRVVIGGIAYAGLRGIGEVEVSLDGGGTWQRAEVKPALNDLSWNLWVFGWAAQPGDYEVTVRATDGTGQTQDAERRRPLPDGATGYHRMRVRVS